MAMIHALLLVSPEPRSTDEVMDVLEISRGNANTNLRELVSWGLLHVIVKRGDRKEYFEAEKDVWKIFCTLARERKRRETEPALQVLRNCAARCENESSEEGRLMHSQLTSLAEFVEVAHKLMDRIAESEENRILPKLIQLLGK